TTVSLNSYNGVCFSSRDDYDKYSDYLDFIDFPESVKRFNRTPYTDIFYNEWYYSYVIRAIDKGIFNGVSPTRFAPNMSMTRAMFATVLYRVEGSPEVTGEMPFVDVEKGTYYYDAVLWAYQNEVVNGIAPDIFGYNGTVTREQLVTMLYRYLAKSGYDVSVKADLSKYPDANKISGYAEDAMSWAVGAYIIQGASMNGEDHLSPRGMGTRAQVAAILWRYSSYINRIPS
ncbi:MAG: S-layer homology domain-containing protein, partial [Clostridia bacterium]|nr:S-layer homology domain-containing protein [Clostridia bacterium]